MLSLHPALGSFVVFLEEIDSCLKEVRLAVPLCVWTQSDQERRTTENPSSRTGRNRWSLANTGRTVFEISCVSLTTQHRKIIKTLLCWYINTCIYRLFLEGVVFPRTLVRSTSVQQAGLLGSKQDRLLIELHSVETAGLGREEENTVI